MRKIYLLDRNIVINIEKYLDGKNTSVASAFSINKLGVFVSPLLSIIEGHLGQESSFESTYDAIERECNICKKFFNKAQTDANYLLSNFFEIISVLSADNIERYQTQKQFIIEIQQLLQLDIAARDRTTTVNDLLIAADKHKIAWGEPIVLVAIARVYQNPNARKLLIKPPAGCTNNSDTNAYNAFMDIAKLKSKAYIKHIFSKENPPSEIQIVTDDVGLKQIDRQLKISIINSVSYGQIERDFSEYNIAFDDVFFGELVKSPQELHLLKSRLAEKKSNKSNVLALNFYPGEILI